MRYLFHGDPMPDAKTEDGKPAYYCALCDLPEGYDHFQARGPHASPAEQKRSWNRLTAQRKNHPKQKPHPRNIVW